MSPARPRERSPRRRLSLLALVLTAGLALGACTSPRNTLGTDSSPCFRALAVARTAVGGRGNYAGVLYLSAKSFLSALTRLEDSVPPSVRHAEHSVCVVNYRGQFLADQVSAGWPAGQSGRFAVVAVDAKTNQLLGTLIFEHPPLRFSRFVI